MDRKHLGKNAAPCDIPFKCDELDVRQVNIRPALNATFFINAGQKRGRSFVQDRCVVTSPPC
jgi:hypothetical protein